jgi:TRAP-type transport system small permease protein
MNLKFKKHNTSKGLLIFSKTLDFLEIFYVLICTSGITFLIIMCFYQAVSRYFITLIDFLWTDELLKLIYPHTIFAGIAIGFRYNDHLAVEFLRNCLPFKIRKIIIFLVYILSILFLVIYTKQSYTLAIRSSLWRGTTAILHISRFWFYISIFYSGIGASFFVIENMLYNLLECDVKPNGITRRIGV